MLIFILLAFLITLATGEEIKTEGPKETALEVDSIIKPDSISTETLSLCTLEINTIPSEALIIVDGKEYGSSPVTVKVDTGTHTIICQKEGFYQKKVVIRVPSYEKTQISIKLTSPAKLKVITEPINAGIFINGEKKGVTPYIDSLFKPGKYIIKLEKEGYISKIDSLEIESGSNITMVDTLQKIVTSLSDEKKEKKFSIFDLCFVGGAFLAFLIIVGIIEIRN